MGRQERESLNVSDNNSFRVREGHEYTGHLKANARNQRLKPLLKADRRAMDKTKMLREAEEMAKKLLATEPNGFPDITPLRPRSATASLTGNCVVCVHARRISTSTRASSEPELLVEWAFPPLGKGKLAWMREGRVQRIAWPEVEIFNARSYTCGKARWRGTKMLVSPDGRRKVSKLDEDVKTVVSCGADGDESERDKTWSSNRKIATASSQRKYSRRRAEVAPRHGQWIAIFPRQACSLPVIRKPRKPQSCSK